MNGGSPDAASVPISAHRLAGFKRRSNQSRGPSRLDHQVHQPWSKCAGRTSMGWARAENQLIGGQELLQCVSTFPADPGLLERRCQSNIVSVTRFSILESTRLVRFWCKFY